MSELRSVRALTFDCYGTLVDWRRGIREAAAQVPSLSGANFARLLTEREEIDAALVRGPYRPYGELLARSLVLAADRQGREVPADEARAFADTMGDWPAFAETPHALARLASRFRLGVLSNVERHTLDRSLASLGVQFEAIVAASELQSYKPARAHFDEALRRLDLAPQLVLHVSLSRFYDLATARALGFRTAWIMREHEAWPRGESPDLSLQDLGALCDALGV